jgi:hypothetical protein
LILSQRVEAALPVATVDPVVPVRPGRTSVSIPSRTRSRPKSNSSSGSSFWSRTPAAMTAQGREARRVGELLDDPPIHRHHLREVDAGGAGPLADLDGQRRLFGGALGMAILGSAGGAVYRHEIVDALPAGIPPAQTDAARETLGGALAVAGGLLGEAGEALLRAARLAFTDGLHVAAVVGAVLMVLGGVLAVALLRDVPVAPAPQAFETRRSPPDRAACCRRPDGTARAGWVDPPRADGGLSR